MVEQAIAEHGIAEQQKRDFDVSVRRVGNVKDGGHYFFAIQPEDDFGPDSVEIIYSEDEVRERLSVLAGDKPAAVEKIMARLNETEDPVKGHVKLTQDVATLVGCTLGWPKGNPAL